MVGHVTPVCSGIRSVAFATAPTTDHTKGLSPCRSVHGWKWSEIDRNANPASSASRAISTRSPAGCSSLDNVNPSSIVIVVPPSFSELVADARLASDPAELVHERPLVLEPFPGLAPAAERQDGSLADVLHEQRDPPVQGERRNGHGDPAPDLLEGRAPGQLVRAREGEPHGGCGHEQPEQWLALER